MTDYTHVTGTMQVATEIDGDEGCVVIYLTKMTRADGGPFIRSGALQLAIIGAAAALRREGFTTEDLDSLIRRSQSLTLGRDTHPGPAEA